MFLQHKKTVDVKCVFQIWSKNHKPETEEFSWYNNKDKEPFGYVVKLLTVSLAKNRECGKRWIFDEKADFYISSTFHDKISIVYDFAEVKYKSGVAVIFTTENQQLKNKIIELFENTDWKITQVWQQIPAIILENQIYFKYCTIIHKY
ncbi:MAG: hypothetical protein LBS50_10270 [Prevotellaceae bacterium]|jgi:hypothetical protein|nr:hypothetical protein [Prevotellaceae bacterium]